MTQYQEDCRNYINEKTEEVNVIKTPKKIGYIYKIISNNSHLIYIGSTFQDINKRYRQHLGNPKTTAKIIISFGDASVELIEQYECYNRLELCRREGYHINKNSILCVNKVIAGRTLQESQKAYREKHKEWYRHYIKEWQMNNKDKVKQYYLNKKNNI
jgi:hypothetical protein